MKVDSEIEGIMKGLHCTVEMILTVGGIVTARSILLQAASMLAPGAWSNVTTFVGTGDTTNIVIQADLGAQFFRLRAL